MVRGVNNQPRTSPVITFCREPRERIEVEALRRPTCLLIFLSPVTVENIREPLCCASAGAVVTPARNGQNEASPATRSASPASVSAGGVISCHLV